MKNSIKAAIMSGFGYPGLGHVILKRYLRGAIFATAATVALVIIVRDAMRLAYPIADKIGRGEIPLDPQIIANLVSTTVESAKSGPVVTALVICWGVALVDSVIIGHRKDRNAEKCV